MTGGLALAVLLAAPARASTFLENLHRAESRDAKDPERVEFASRAIRAWTPSDGPALLADARFRRGEGEFAAWNDAAAEMDLSEALKLDERNDAALLLRARVRLRDGRAPGAEADFASYAGARPDDGEGWLGLAEARLARGLPRADRPALDAAGRAAKLLDDGDPRPRIAEGRAQFAAGRRMKALDAFERAVAAARPPSADALAWRARAKAALGDPRGARDDGALAAESYERALDDLRRARAPAPASADVRGLLADVRYRRGGTEEKLSLIDDAREDYRLACDLGREDACARAAVLAPKAAAPAPKRKKRRFVPNPDGDSGTRIYAN